jgi:DNA-directed RNA polymerase specialized sigma24 family protein
MPKEPTDHADDLELRRKVLEGTAACEELAARVHQPLERLLVGLCGRTEGRARERAVEIAAGIVADLPSLLGKWNGSGSLEGFLSTTGKNLLKSWWRSPDNWRFEGGSDSPEMEHAAQTADGETVEETEVRLASQALREGVRVASDKTPEGLCFLRLKGLHGTDQRVVARCWGLDESGISRRITAAMETIRETAAAAALGKTDEALPYAALQLALQRDPSILLGGGEDGGPADDALLAGVARGHADKEARLAAATAMCRSQRNLALFAGLLNRESGHGPAVVKDPELPALEARLTECVRRTLELLRPADAAGWVTPLMSDTFADSLNLIGADGGTLWLLSPGEAVLEAVFNPMEPDLAGKRQPLVSGIVSLVLATGENACVGDVSSHNRHSSMVDHAVGKTTRGMIAVPFHLGGSARGVLTAVRFTGERAFGEAETEVLSRSSGVLAALLTRRIEEKILAS